MKTWWLSFAGDVDGVDTHLGAVLVDGCENFLEARLAITFAGLPSPGGECLGLPVEPEDVPEEYREVFQALPRMKVLSKDDLRVLGPLVNTDGEAR